MSAPVVERAKRAPLATRLALLISGLTAVSTATGMAAVWIVTSRLEGPELDRSLDRAHEVAEVAIGRRLGNLELVASLLGHDPPFRAYVTEGDAASILDNLKDRLALSGCDAFLVTDRAGELLADTRRVGGASTNLAANALIAAAVQGKTVRGLWREPGGGLYLAAASPIVQGGADVAGTVVALDGVDDAFATELRAAAGAEVVVYAAEARQPQGASVLAARAELGRITDAAQRVSIGGEFFAARSYSLEGFDGKAAGRLVVLRPRDRTLTALRSVETALLWVGAVSVLLAVGASVWLARRITRPVADLVTATQRIAAGDLDAVFPSVSDDEMGTLADAFRSMVGQLKEKADMEAYLASVVRGAGAPPATPDSADGDATTTRGADLLAGRFELGPMLGGGATGTVFRAVDHSLGELVAVKILNNEAQSVRASANIVQEVRVARRITHRNVVRTHDIVALADGWAISMEYVDGLSLSTLLRRGLLPVTVALGLARQIAAGLEAAHAQAIVHRDLKPGNILLNDRGVAKIADFGLARIQDDLAGATRHGRLVGTPLYMSPEQAEGRAADARSDVYAAGAIFFELFCGRPPFQADTLDELLAMHVRSAPLRPRDLRAELSPTLELVILRALEKDPTARFPSARELVEALR